jgi:hypothetical protein
VEEPADRGAGVAVVGVRSAQLLREPVDLGEPPVQDPKSVTPAGGMSDQIAYGQIVSA